MYFNLRYFFRLTGVYFKRFKMLIFISLISGVLVFLMINTYLIPKLSKNIVTIGLTGRFTTSDLPKNITLLISNGLTEVGENNIPSGKLAKSWKVDESGKVWTFELNEGIEWHDGKLLHSNDINYDFSDIEIQKPDEKTIIFSLKNKYAPLANILSRPVFKNGYIGVGDWKVKKLLLNGEYIQTLDLVNSEGTEIIYKFYPTDERTKLSFKLGEVSKIEGLLDPKPFSDWGDKVNLEKYYDYDQVVTIFLNTKDGVLEDKTLRQALNYALNKDGFGDRALSPISPNSYFYNPQVKRYDYDRKRAQELIKDIPKDTLSQMEITLVTSPYLLNIADTISQNWTDLGIKTNILVSSIIPDDFQAYLTILDIPKDPDQYPLWHSTQTSTNISKYSNPRIDKLLEDGRSEYELEKRKEIYIDFQRFLNEDTPAIFISFPQYFNVLRK
jgi:peptide/nickel transport system substrate-binding protein